MLLTLSTTLEPATDLGFLLHKHPGRVQAFPLSFGQAHVFYPEAGDDCCTAALLRSMVEAGHLVSGFSQATTDLEEIFLNIVEGDKNGNRK